VSYAAAVRKPVDATAVSTMALLCLIWGMGHVAAKLAAPGISLVFQAGLRSAIAAVLLLIYARVRGIRLFDRDATLPAGLLAGALFAGEFVFIFAGLNFTGASRMVVFVYLAPCLTALGLHFFLPSERLNAQQWAGILLAFAGVAVAFWDGFAAARSSLLGDAFGVIGAALWAATTVVIRITRLSQASASKTLFYQLAVSAAALPLVSLALHEPAVIKDHAAGSWRVALSSCDRDLRELPRLVLAAYALSRRAPVGVRIFDSAVRCRRRRHRLARAAARRVRGRSRAGRRRNLSRKPADALVRRHITHTSMLQGLSPK
jgi:drug/metabolite transporter (DMT)-like permease